MFGPCKTVEELVKASGGRWYGHVLKRNDNSVLRVVLDLEMISERKQGQLKKISKKQIKDKTEKVGLMLEYALD